MYVRTLKTQSSSSSSSDSDSTSANSTLPQLTIPDKVFSKLTPAHNDIMLPVPIKVDNFELCPRPVANQAEASISGGRPIIQVEGHSNLASPSHHTEPMNHTLQLHTDESEREEVARADKAYQGMMASFPTFVKNSPPPNPTDDQLDGIT
ncbi:hypothetical protein LIER_06217 [Lithospermum erythrorhizon]|uniref:Uncharacterized protein n=1 Tax=Lithospermum erythrorhizon TaxID=34254 RepID=A0AAV3P847_LITER